MVFFTDRDLGALFPRILSEAGLSVETHDSHFPHGTKDVEWLPAVGRNGWFVLSRDKRIRYRPNEQAAVMRAGVGLFLVVGAVSHETLARNFVDSVARVERFAKNRRARSSPRCTAHYRDNRAIGSGKPEEWSSGCHTNDGEIGPSARPVGEFVTHTQSRQERTSTPFRT